MTTVTRILIMIATVYTIRLLPMLLFRKTIGNRFVRSFLYYVPFVTLSVMTFPAIVSGVPQRSAGVAALIAGTVSAYAGASLPIVAVITCAAYYVVSLIFPGI